MRTCRLWAGLHTGAGLLGVVLSAQTLMPPAYAAEGGYTNYVPGLYGDFGVAVMPDPGFYMRTDLYHYSADASGARLVQGGEIRADLDLDITMLMMTGLKVLDARVLGGRYAFGAFVPASSMDISGKIATGAIEVPFDEDLTALGDIGIMPVSLFWSHDRFHLNAYHTVTMATGSFDKDDDLSAGLNYWSFDTNLAMTYLNEDKGRELSATVGYIYNTENDDTDYQSGQELHLDSMLNQFFSETFAVGVHGFYYRQVTGDSGSGALLGSNMGEAAGIGPAITWTGQLGGRPLIFSAKWLHEFHAERRLEGDNFYLNLTIPF